MIGKAWLDNNPVSLLTLMGKLSNVYGIPPFTATLGICDDGAPLLIRLPSDIVGHVLVSGAGTSSLLRIIAISLAVCNRPRDMRLVLAGDFGNLARLPHARYHSINDIVRLVGRSVLSPRVVIVIDDLTMIDTSFARILHEGHAAGVHIVASGSSMSSAGFGTLINGNGEPGYFIAIAAGQQIRFKAACITSTEIGQVAAGLLPKRGTR